jgi:hypothetical protein
VNLRQQAKGRECQMRWPGTCNHNPETVVLAHYRLSGISGMGMKSPDEIAGWLCSECHRLADTDKSPEVQLAFAQAVFRTQATLLREGKIHE